MTVAASLLTILTGPTRHLFLSPHYDDIPLSAGGTAKLLANHGRKPEMAVVFGSEPDPAQPLTPFAIQLHNAWGLTANAVIASRRAEEHAAATILGAETAVLPFRDAIYRGHRYLSDDDLFGVPSPEESTLSAEIVGALALPKLPADSVRIYAPLGVGGHVDHQIVFHAALELARTGWDVWFYEDIPYSLKPNAFDSRFADILASITLEPVALSPVASVWEAKLDAILSYPSQLETVFRSYVGVGTSRHEISDALATYARSVGEGVIVERFWRVSDPHTTGMRRKPYHLSPV